MELPSAKILSIACCLERGRDVKRKKKYVLSEEGQKFFSFFCSPRYSIAQWG